MKRLYYFLLTILRIIKYLLSDTKRYANILIEILKVKPRSVVEVGVYKGKRSLEIIQAAKIFNDKIKFYGFDLFEMIEDKIIKNELSKKPLSKKKIYRKLSSYCDVKLYKGYSNKTLPKLKNKKIDFIFIDGGHKVSTIKSDWKNCFKFVKQNTVIIFDDYYLDDKLLIKKYGCNKIVNSISSKNFTKKLLPMTDSFWHQGKNLKIKIFYLKSN